jgi:hypothetical protein
MGKKFMVVRNTQAEPDPMAMPVGLETAGAALWRHVTSAYDVSDPSGVCLLTEACRALDRAEKCRAHIDRDGEIVMAHGVPREHALLKAELANRAFCTRTLVRLGLNFEPLRTSVGRPYKQYNNET